MDGGACIPSRGRADESTGAVRQPGPRLQFVSTREVSKVKEGMLAYIYRWSAVVLVVGGVCSSRHRVREPIFLDHFDGRRRRVHDRPERVRSDDRRQGRGVPIRAGPGTPRSQPLDRCARDQFLTGKLDSGGHASGVSFAFGSWDGLAARLTSTGACERAVSRAIPRGGATPMLAS